MISLSGRTALTSAVLFLGLALPALLAPRHFPSDDALFYMQIARNIASGHGSTFNTLTPTNGYHPLWMGPCAVAALLSGGEPTRMLQIAFAMQALLTAGSLLLFRAVARRLSIRAWLLGIPILAGFFLTGMYGSEAHLNGVCVLASLLCLLRMWENPSASRAVVLGALLGLTLLARLDNLFLVLTVFVGFAIALPAHAARQARALAIAILFMAVVVAPYLAWNVANFGHLVPISGAIKSTFPRVTGDLRNLGALGLVTGVIALSCVVGLVAGRFSGTRRLTVAVLATGVLAQGIYVVLFTNHDTHWAWYYVSGVILATILLCIVADAARSRSEILRHRAVAAVAIGLLVTVGLVRGWARYANSAASSHNQFVFRILPAMPNERWEIQFTKSMERNLPRQAAVLVYDYPGYFAFYSSLRIVPADGLVGDFRSDKELLGRGLGYFLDRHAIEFYVGRDLAPPDTCRTERIYAPLEAVDAGALRLCRGDRVTATSEVVRDVPFPEVALFRIRGVLGAAGAHPPERVKHGALW